MLKFLVGDALKFYWDVAINAVFFYFRRKAENVKGRGADSVRRGLRDAKAVPTPEFNAQGDVSLKVF